jgi:hypothetical protein
MFKKAINLNNCFGTTEDLTPKSIPTPPNIQTSVLHSLVTLRAAALVRFKPNFILCFFLALAILYYILYYRMRGIRKIKKGVGEVGRGREWVDE